jgi:hypothetical protein
MTSGKQGNTNHARLMLDAAVTESWQACPLGKLHQGPPPRDSSHAKDPGRANLGRVCYPCLSNQISLSAHVPETPSLIDRKSH